ncbi:protein kinase domain-containing protein [Ditylenchus destructor]|nr:protein kinase domain-containing protein [Ditylenchus destructor]
MVTPLNNHDNKTIIRLQDGGNSQFAIPEPAGRLRIQPRAMPAPARRTISKEGDKADNDNTEDLKANLMKLMIGDDLRIKVQYMDERCALNLMRPVNFKSLEQYFHNKYRRQLNIYYTTSSKELMIQIKNQDELDHVIQLYDKTGGKKRMRLILSQKRDAHESFSMPPLGVYQGICETALSDTSSVLSTPSSYHASRLLKCPEDEAACSRIETPRPPTNWREGRCLGRGAFGHVFVCLNIDTGEQLVVKKIYIRGNSRFRNRILASLENEVNLLGTLRHPNIVQYFGVQERPDCVNIFMELMAGGSLKDQITEYGELSEANSVDFTVQILTGLEYLHQRDIVHRDIKSANILRHTRAHVKIGDFGSAKYLQAICSEQGVDIMGTPHYNAPEIVRDSRKFDHRSDIWSVGVTLIEMLTTHTPWWDIEANAVHIKIAFEQPQYQLPPEVSTQLRTTLEWMLQMCPEKRPSAKDLLKTPPFASVNDSLPISDSKNATPTKN